MKEKRKKTWLILAVVAGLALLVVAAGAATLFLKQKEAPYIAKIDGKPVSVGEYIVFLYEQKTLFESIGGNDIWEMDFDGETSENVAKRNALQRISVVRTTAKQAKKMNITLTEEEKQLAEDAAQQVYANISASDIAQKFVTVSQVTAVMEDMQLLSKVYDETTKNVVLSEKDFADYFSQYSLENEENLSKRTQEELAELKDIVRESYMDSKKKVIFEQACAKWSEGSVTTINNEKWDEISISDLQ